MSSTKSSSSSDEAVGKAMTQGLEDILLHTAGGLVLGLGIGLAVARKNPTKLKVLAGFGSGCGLGSAWCKTSMELEEMLKHHK